MGGIGVAVGGMGVFVAVGGMGVFVAPLPGVGEGHALQSVVHALVDVYEVQKEPPH